MKKLYRASRWIHKYIGLALLLFGAWMSFSGILLNHPEWISGVDVPSWLVPPQYEVKDWNRSALIEVAWDPDTPSRAVLAGKKGIWLTEDGGRSFSEAGQGLANQSYYRKAYSLQVSGSPDNRIIYAGTEGGLYYGRLHELQWQPVHLGEGRKAIKSVLATEQGIAAFSASEAWFRPYAAAPDAFEHVELKRPDSAPHTVSLVTFFFDLHDGAMWGLPGKLLFDLAGLVIIFLCVTAFYIWFYPWRQKRRIRKGVAQTARHGSYNWMARKHNTWGIWFALLLAIISFTGIFMRPPLLALIAEGEVPVSAWPGFSPPGPWENRITNALYEQDTDTILIAATDGVWRGPADFSGPFAKVEGSAPIFVMGATVFESKPDDTLFIGSFSGMFQQKGDRVIDLLSGDIAEERSTVRPADIMVTGYVETPDDRQFITAHEQGLLPLGDSERGELFQMPAAMADRTLPLWNWMFELHNGRIFADLIGNWYILLVPLGSILFFLITVTGVIDWLYLKRRRN